MTTKEFLTLEKKLLPHLTGFAISGRLMFLTPLKNTLQGISFEGSDFDKNAFYVSVFLLPLCVPTRHLYFNFGNRLRHSGGGDRWNMNMPNLIEELCTSLKREALSLLVPIESLKSFVEVAKSFSFKNPHTPQAVAYALIRVGDFQNARPALTQLLQQIDLKVEWQREMAERAETLKRMLDLNPTDAQRQLEIWEVETIKNLGLESFC